MRFATSSGFNKMSEKQNILDTMRDEFKRWETLLTQLDEAQIVARTMPSDLSIKDVVAHLWEWQQRSIARLEAGLNGTEPQFPVWPEGLDPEQDDVEAVNAWIHEKHLDQAWSSVHADWRTGFLHLIELGDAIPENVLLDTKRFGWLDGYSLAQILTSSYEHHHHDHLEPLLEWLRQHGSESKHTG